MRKRVLALFLVLLLALSMLPGTAAAGLETLSGSGTAEDPCQIGDAQALKAFRELVNAGETGLCAVLTADIDLGGEPWEPFYPDSGYVTDAFAGTFDGAGHEISGLWIDSTLANQGLFGLINGATICNLRVSGAVTSTRAYVGGIVGKIQSGTIENCSFSGSVTSTAASGAYAGGIAGGTQNVSVITGCFNAGTVTGYAGGILGYGKAALTNCANVGEIRGTTRAGGIVGQFNGTASSNAAENCYSAGAVSVSATDYAYAGGISGFNGTLVNCYWLAPESGTGNETGTLTGCRQVESPDGLAGLLGSAFAEDEEGINNGWPVLTWQAGGGSDPGEDAPALRLTPEEGILWVQEQQGSGALTLTASCTGMGTQPPAIIWSCDNAQAVTYSELDDTHLLVRAQGGGMATVTASVEYEGTQYTAEAEIMVVPYVTAVSIVSADPDNGAVAVGQTVRADVRVLGGDVYDTQTFPPLTYQWYHFDSVSGFTAIPGAVGAQYALSPTLFEEWDKVAVEVCCAGQVVSEKEDTAVSVRSQDYGLLYPVAYDPDFMLPADVRDDTPLSLPDTHSVGAVSADVTWTSSNEAVISQNGTVVRPEHGTQNVTLTARFSYGGAFANRSFTVCVWSDEAIEQAQAASQDRLGRAVEALGTSFQLRPVYGRDENVAELLTQELAERGFDDIDVAVTAVREVYGGAAVDADGTLTYFYADPDAQEFRPVWFGSLRVDFTLSADGASLAFADVPVLVDWDAARVRAVMQERICSRVDEQAILGGNISADEVRTDLTLPVYIDGKTWTEISWTSSVPDAIEIVSGGAGAPFTGIVRPGETDCAVTLTAAFTFRLSAAQEPIVLYRTFDLTVPALGTEQAEDIRQRLLAVLNTGLSETGLTDAVTGQKLTAGANGIYMTGNDILLPAPRDFGVDGSQYPITVTSACPEVVTAPQAANATRLTVYRPPVGGGDGRACVTVSIRDAQTSVSASVSFEVSVPALTQEEVDAELALMERVKAGYAQALCGENAAPDDIRKDLARFVEVYADTDGTLVWVRESADVTGRGIAPAELDGWEELEAWRLFRSSNPSVISHETLLVTRQPAAKAVTVTSSLSSQTLGRYGQLYQSDPEQYAGYAALAGLYAQPVSAQFLVRGTEDPSSTTPETETITVTFALQGHGSVKIPRTTLQNLDEASTVYDIFRSVLKEEGFTYESTGTYVTAITAPDGETLAEFDKGPYSGWMFRVNGEIPSVSMGAYGLHDGDRVEVFYTDDFFGESGYTGSWSAAGAIKPREVQEVESLIAAIGTVDASSGDKIRAARAAYDKLSDAYQMLVENYDVLKAAEAAYALLDEGPDFVDVPDDAWYAQAVAYVCKNGLFEGTGENLFSPDASMTRAMLVTVLYRLAGQPSAPAADFSDVPAGAWYADAVSWAVDNDLTNGYGDGRFGPNDPITREQLAVLLMRFAAFREYDTTGRDDLAAFADVDQVSPWAGEGVSWAVSEKIITGRTQDTLDPCGTATRAEVATMLMRLCTSAAAQK